MNDMTLWRVSPMLIEDAAAILAEWILHKLTKEGICLRVDMGAGMLSCG